MYTLRDIYNQAKEDRQSISSTSTGNTPYESESLYDCKITCHGDDDGDVLILNTALGGDWYTNIAKVLEEIFIVHGWRIGVYELTLSNCRQKLETIEKEIKEEVNGRLNPKKIKSLKNSRNEVMNYYHSIKKKKFNYITKKE